MNETERDMKKTNNGMFFVLIISDFIQPKTVMSTIELSQPIIFV